MPTDVIFSDSPSEWTKVEGLSVSSVKRESVVTGANVNTVGLYGTAVRGPSTPQDCADPSDFLALYGGRDNGGGGAITGGMWKGLLNRKFSWPMVTCRVVDPDAVAATATLATSGSPGTNVLTVTATSVGTWANNASGTGVSVTVSDASDGSSTHFNLTVKYGGQQVVYKNLDINATGVDNTSTVVGDSPYNWIKLTKLANGRPVNVADVALANGTDGAVALADYETAFDAVAANSKPRIVVCSDVVVDADNTQSLATYVASKADQFPLTIFPVWAGENNTRAAEITAKQTALSTPQNNVWWCYNASSTQDNTGTLVETGPHLDMAAILANTDVAVHPGDEDNATILAGVKKVANESLTRGDLALLRAAGICTLEKVDKGFVFHSCVASSSAGPIGDDLAVEGVDVRRKAWLCESLAKAYRHDVKKASTDTRRKTMIGKGEAFCRDDQKAEHVVAKDSATLGRAFQFQWVETPQERARNIGKLMTKIRMLSYNLAVVLLTDINTGTTTIVK